MEATNIKDEARHMVEDLSDNASWDDLMYKIYVRQAVEAGLADSEAGRTVDVKDTQEYPDRASKKVKNLVVLERSRG